MLIIKVDVNYESNSVMIVDYYNVNNCKGSISVIDEMFLNKTQSRANGH